MFGSSLVKSLEQAKESFRRPAMVDILTLSILCALGLVNPQIFFLKVNAIDIVVYRAVVLVDHQDCGLLVNSAITFLSILYGCTRAP